MITPQTATPPAAGTPAAAAAAAAQPKKGLDDFLREFDTAPAPQPQPAPRPAQAAAAAPAGGGEIAAAIRDEVEKIVAPIRGEVQQTRRERELREIDGVVETVRQQSDFLKNVDAEIVFGHLQGLAARDPRFRAAWMQRGSKPDAFAQVLKAAGERLEEKLKPIAAAPSADARAAVMAAARQASSAPPQGAKTQDEVRKMSDSEFRAYKRSLAASGRRR